jgi:hypothetical protein
MSAPQYVYLEKTPKSGIYRCRGALGPGDDFDSFQQKMRNNGLESFVSEAHQGREIQITEGESGPVTNVLEV